MLLIEDDTLVHVDSASDILEHYGVKGMRWGKRKAKLEARLAAHKRVLDGDPRAVRNRTLKRALVGGVVGGGLGMIVGGMTTKGGAQRGYNRTANKLNKMARKEHIENAKDAYEKSSKNKQLNKKYDSLEKQYDAVSSRKVGLFDRSGRKQKKSELRNISGKIDAIEKKQIDEYTKAKQRAKDSFKPRY